MKHLDIEWREWTHTCADGCCTRWGIEVFVNGESIGDREFGDAGSAMELLAQHLGYTSTVIKIYDEE